ncbi:hypothetical protein DFJ74DRAFT_640163 [Hyaloraphidium curvatum]|nr:hypothetical protein DFJ74DRAFT_640163 [Hyaloraphidium curvatum]
MRAVAASIVAPARMAALQQARARVFGLPSTTSSKAALKVLDQPLMGQRLNEWHYPDINVVEVARRLESLKVLNLQDMDLEKRKLKEAYKKSRNQRIWNLIGAKFKPSKKAAGKKKKGRR